MLNIPIRKRTDGGIVRAAPEKDRNRLFSDLENLIMHQHGMILEDWVPSITRMNAEELGEAYEAYI